MEMEISKKILVTLLSFLCMAGTMKADDVELYLLSTDGTSYTALDVANLRSICIAPHTVTGTGTGRSYQMTTRYADGTSTEYRVRDYASILFESTEVVGIDDVATASGADFDQPFRFVGQQVLTNAAGTLYVYSIDGRQVGVQTVAQGGRFSIQSLAPGTYIVKMNGQSAKIQVK